MRMTHLQERRTPARPTQAGSPGVWASPLGWAWELGIGQAFLFSMAFPGGIYTVGEGLLPVGSWTWQEAGG